jgi:dihydrofolate reductase
MRNVILYFHMSLDNVVSDPDKWMLMNDDILKSAIQYYEQLDTVIFGSNTYPFMADYWPKAEQNSTSDIERQFAKKINEIKKIVLSRSAVNIIWQNSELLNYSDNHSLSKSLRRLKQQEGKNISVESGIGIWKLFLENSLFDELFISIHPVIVGKGERLFLNIQKNYELALKQSRTLDNGVVELQYAKK